MPKRTVIPVLDARPDRIDLRDRIYQPRLVDLPPTYPTQAEIDAFLPAYLSASLILDQQSEGACTGFGLAAMINFTLWQRARRTKSKIPVESVSPAMLYHLAQIYDEWKGEDYEGSSCRGAMKGWHRHGACLWSSWPFVPKKIANAKPGWERNAADRPLGAYYRIERQSIADMQSAIFEVGAIYVSASVHDGWRIGTSDTLPVLAPSRTIIGGHAFALVGWTRDGFIVQNSWGSGWGYQGFAVMRYADWFENGSDAWVGMPGVPVPVSSPKTVSSISLHDLASGRSAWPWSKRDSPASTPPDGIPAWDEETVSRHSVIFDNDGRPRHHLIEAADGAASLKSVALLGAQAWVDADPANRRIALYAHGGLNSEADALKRCAIMGPYFLANGIYPLFLIWRTGFLESVTNIMRDAVNEVLGVDPSQGFFEKLWLDAKKYLQSVKDRTIEMASEKVMVKSVWGQMKQNAGAAGERGSGLDQLAACLAALKKKPELHIMGHSAGAILLGHFLDCAKRHGIKVSSGHLFAPACTARFAVEHYLPAFRSTLPPDAFTCHVLSHERELADSVGPYGKSLLFLVSRALETCRLMPILGMEGTWNTKIWDAGKCLDPHLWHDSMQPDVQAWRAGVGKYGLAPVVHKPEYVSDGIDPRVRLAHGSFDNDVAVIGDTLKLIRGGNKLPQPVVSLHGF